MPEFKILEVREERIGEMLGGGLLAAGGARDGPGGNVSHVVRVGQVTAVFRKIRALKKCCGSVPSAPTCTSSYPVRCFTIENRFRL